MTDKHIQLLIDADILTYKICTACEVETFWGADQYGSDLITLHSKPKECMDKVKEEIDNLKKRFDTDDVILVFSSRTGYFREDFMPDYKHHRKPVRPPLALGYVKEECKKIYPSMQEDRLEADDVLSLLATEPCDNIIRIIVSVDKDFKSVPCNLYNAMSDSSKKYETISKDEAYEHFLMQVLTGDAADGYKGLPNCGPVTAAKILAKEGNKWDNVVEEFKKKGYNEEYILVQARCAHLLQHGDYDWSTKEIKLWTNKS